MRCNFATRCQHTGLKRNATEHVTSAEDSYKLPGDKETSKGTLPYVVKGEAIVTTGFSGLGKIIPSCSTNSSEILDLGATITGGASADRGKKTKYVDVSVSCC